MGVVVWGGVLSSAMTALILLTLYYWPRLLLHHQPKIIQNAVPARSEKEKRLAIVAALLSLVLVVGLPVLVSLASARTPVEAFTHAFGIVAVFGLVDLLIIDWLVICWLTPSFVVMPGTQGSPGYKDYRHHAIGFLKSLPLAAAIGLAAAAATWLKGFFDV